MCADLNYFYTNGFDQSTHFTIVLDLQNGFTEEDVKKSYKKLILVFHPDKHSKSVHRSRYECIAKFINKKKSQALQWLKSKSMKHVEPDNPAGEEASFQFIDNAVVVYQHPTEEICSGDDISETEEEFVDMEDDAGTQGVQYHQNSADGSDEEGEEGQDNGNESSTGPTSSAAATNTNHSATHAIATTGNANVCVCNNRPPHYHLLFQAPGLSPHHVRCPLCTLTFPRDTTNKNRLAQHVKTFHHQRCYTRDPNKRAPMSGMERVRRHRAKKNIAKHGLYLQG